MKYYIHGRAGSFIFSTKDLTEAKQYADKSTYKVTVSTQHNGKSCWDGKPCKVFNTVYNNGKK